MSTDNDYPLPLTYPFPLGPHGTPPPVLAWARKHHPVCPVVLPSGAEVWMITRKDDITQVFTDPRFSRDLVYLGAPRFVGEDFTSIPGGIFNLDPPDHTRVRKVLSPFYNPRAVQRYQPMVERHAHQLLAAMAAGPNPADLMQTYAGPLPLWVSCEILGVPVRHRADYLEAFRTQATLTVDPDQIATATAQTLEFTAQVIATKRRDPDPGEPIGALIAAQQAGIISEAELQGTVSYLFVTGSEPLVPPLSVGVLTLILHRNQLKECLAEETLWPKAVEEILRYHHNGVLGLPRVATEDLTLHSVNISAGDGVCAPMLGATWDPRHYHHPSKFDIHRDTDATATFGAGPHFCLGAAYSRMFLTTAYTALFRALPDLTLAVSENDIPWKNDLVLVRPAQLPVSWPT